ncbi:hypothetical protein CHUAL_009578 [Chamberlinius hualienensis]
MSIAALLEAAEYLDRREREAEHGYASTMPMPNDLNNNNNHHHHHQHSNRRKTKSKKSQGNSRHTHNELEKNRRAHLRNCLEKLKDLVPLGPDANRHTTLGLLTKAKAFIKNLEDKQSNQVQLRDRLKNEKRYLEQQLEELKKELNFQQRRSVSECSSSSTTSSTSETDDVDIMSYNHSDSNDSDDQSSIQSGVSDDGVAVRARRLTLVEVF